MIVKTRLSEQSEQFELEGSHYVGRRVLCNGVVDAFFEFGEDDTRYMILFNLDYDRGQVFIDPSLLTPFPSDPIPEPTK
jgi:hypothetical protein